MESSYDEVPYTSHAFPETHPSRMAAVGILGGLHPADVTRARVLELGCARGGNLLPMASGLPEARFVGLDLSGGQIDEASAIARTAGLSNVELLQKSITDVGKDLGTFDYIVCHGVYSWVPDVVQDAILRVCKENLAENGLALISYNTYPGWHVRGMVREMLEYHTQKLGSPRQRIGQARALLEFLAGAVPSETGPYATLLGEEIELLREMSDAYLFHEHLEEVNAPLYFHQFAERASARGLAYVGETTLSRTAVTGFSPEVTEKLASAGMIQSQQYMDFLRNQRFRMSLLCHAERPLSHAPTPDRLRSLSLATSARPVSEGPDLTHGTMESFASKRGTLGINDALCKAAFVHLADEAPRAVPYEELLSAARRRLGREGRGPDLDEDHTTLSRELLNLCMACDVVNLYAHSPEVTRTPGERPLADPHARYLASQGLPVINRFHETVALGDPVSPRILSLLDGTRDRAALLEDVLEQVRAGVFVPQDEHGPVTDEAKARAILQTAVREILSGMAAHALIVR